MEIKINGTNYPLTFGFDFIDYVNEKNGIEANGMRLPIGGAAMLNAGLEQRTPSSLRLLIKGGTCALKQQPSNQDIDDFINEVSDDDDAYDKLFDDIQAELGKHPATRREMGITKKAD